MARHVAPDDIYSCGLTLCELQEMWLGPNAGGSNFASTEELRGAWERGRATVMRLWANNGRRPMAWWCFDAPGLGLKWPGYDRQQSYLFEHNALEETECVALVAYWRAEFEQASTLNNAGERKAHLDWADVPGSLRRRWSASARRRRARQPSASSEEEAAAVK